MKAAQRDMRKRAKKLRELADEDPGAFDLEWHKILNSYAREIWREAGVLRTQDGEPMQPVFRWTKRAEDLLEMIGEDIAEKYREQTREFLTHTIVKAFAIKTGNPELYRLHPAVH